MVFSMATERVGERPAPFDRSAVRRHFARAAATYDAAAVLQREVGARLAANLDVVKLDPRRILDAGCGTGDALGDFATRYPVARRVALDLAWPMLRVARDKSADRRTLADRWLAPLRRERCAPAPVFACADVAALPFAAGSFDLVWSNLALQWVSDLPHTLREFLRVLDVGGLLTFTTFGPDTLKELRAAFAAIDGEPHVSPFVDLHDLGDMLMDAGFADPVMHMEHFTLTYDEPMAMLRDLKAIGATNARHDRARGLMGRGRWTRLLAGLEALRARSPGAKLPATYEVVYGHAWKTAPTRIADGRAIINVVRPGRTGH
jgi:malonyl-CoA O-methyltransferase